MYAAIYINSAGSPQARKSFPESYNRLWDHANRTGGLFSMQRSRGSLPAKGIKDMVENGAAYMTQSKIDT